MKVSSLRLLALGALVATNAIALAGEVDKTISPVAWAQCDQYGKRLTPWQPIVQNGITPAVPTWAVGYDGMCADLVTGGLFGNPYGAATSPGARTAFNVGTTGQVTSATAPPATQFMNAPFAINDITAAPGAQGKDVHRNAINWSWNPGGTFPTRSGSAVCLFILATYDSAGEFLSGVLFSFGAALASGSYNGTSIPTTPTDYGLNMPYGSGSMQIAIGTDDGLGNFIQLPAPGNACVRFHPWCAPNDPNFPGTNPSSTEPGFALDDSSTATGNYVPSTIDPLANNPDFIITFANETVPATGADAYIFNSPIVPTTRQLEPAWMVATDTSAVYFEGTLNLNDLDPGTLRPVTNATFEIRDNDNFDAPVVSRTVALGPNGEFSVLAKVDAGVVRNGNFNIRVKKTHWLGKKIGPIAMTGSSVTGLVIDCLNGDANDDNVIDIGDYAILSAAYGSDPSAGNWDVNADFNHDDIVDIVDYAILSSNYGAAGDD